MARQALIVGRRGDRSEVILGPTPDVQDQRVQFKKLVRAGGWDELQLWHSDVGIRKRKVFHAIRSVPQAHAKPEKSKKPSKT